MAARTAPQPVHLTTGQLAARWHKTPQAIRCLHSRGKAPGGSFRVGKDRLWPLAAVEAWERARTA